MRTPNYDIAYKINACEEYYNRIASDSTITKIAFAKEKDIKYTTFLTWLGIYNNQKLNKENDGAIHTSSTKEITVPKFIEISERTITNKSNTSQKDNGKVTLKYKDIALEFDDNSLEKALEIIKRW